MNEQRFAVGEICSARSMNDFIGGKHQGGIRYAGNFPDIRRIGVIIGGGEDAIYDDEIHGSTITYIGEGLTGDQKLRIGNRALVWAHLTDIAVHVFLFRGKSTYEYWGVHNVRSVATTIAPDSRGDERGVFVFELEKSRVRPSPG